MAHRSKAGLFGLLLLAGSASGTMVGPIKGTAVAGRPLEVNVPFVVDEPADRACASANVRYGNGLVPRSTLHVQGHGLKRNLLVTSRATVKQDAVTVNVRVGCGPKAVTRKFVMLTNMSAGKSSPPGEASRRRTSSDVAVRPVQKPVALVTSSEPLFPPPASPEVSQESLAQQPDPSLHEELRSARAEAATASAQLAATRKELAAVLDVERRTAQTLINADHAVRNAKSEVASMRSVLIWTGTGLALAAVGIAWLQLNLVGFRRRTPMPQPAREPSMFSGVQMPT
jgi:hypothetical protein